MENKIPFVAVIKEASAGTGKTHSIMEEILKLKEKYNSYDILKRILGISFSESAAIELKERLISLIFDQYKNASEEEKVKIENILLNLNFSTIHSFARKILKRFSIFIGIDPFFQVIDENESQILFSEAMSKVFSNPEKLKIFYEIMKNLKLNNFSEIIFAMRKLHPYLFLGEPLYHASLTKKITDFYKMIEDAPAKFYK